MNRRDAIKGLLTLPAIAGAVAQAKPVPAAAAWPVGSSSLADPLLKPSPVIVSETADSYYNWAAHNARAVARFEKQFAEYMEKNNYAPFGSKNPLIQ